VKDSVTKYLDKLLLLRYKNIRTEGGGCKIENFKLHLDLAKENEKEFLSSIIPFQLPDLEEISLDSVRDNATVLEFLNESFPSRVNGFTFKSNEFFEMDFYIDMIEKPLAAVSKNVHFSKAIFSDDSFQRIVKAASKSVSVAFSD